MNINKLLQRYNLKTRQSLYNRINGLNLNLEKDSEGKTYANSAQIKLLDDLDNYLKNGGTIQNFTPTVYPQIDTSLDTKKQTTNVLVSSDDKTPVQLELFDLVQVIKSVTKQQQSPLQNLRELQSAVDNGWILTTAQVHELLGAKPTGKEWERGCFKFVQKGKIGNQNGWGVFKNS